MRETDRKTYKLVGYGGTFYFVSLTSDQVKLLEWMKKNDVAEVEYELFADLKVEVI